MAPRLSGQGACWSRRRTTRRERTPAVEDAARGPAQAPAAGARGMPGGRPKAPSTRRGAPGPCLQRGHATDRRAARLPGGGADRGAGSVANVVATHPSAGGLSADDSIPCREVWRLATDNSLPSVVLCFHWELQLYYASAICFGQKEADCFFKKTNPEQA